MLLNRNDLINIKKVYKNSISKQSKKILICAGTGCVAGGALDIYEVLVRLMEKRGINCSIALEKEWTSWLLRNGTSCKNRALGIFIHKGKA